jgi:hypothetical protein
MDIIALVDIFGIITNTALLIFVAIYLLHLRSKEKKLQERENKVDTSYHQIVDEALSKERKIIEDASSEASKILSNTHQLNQSAVNVINQALQKMAEDIQKNASTTSQDYFVHYQNALKHIAQQTINELQSDTKTLQTDLQNQLKDFRNSFLPSIQKEVEEYKQTRFKEIDNSVRGIVERVTKDVLNKSIPTEDHEKLVLDSLEKARKEGIFD